MKKLLFLTVALLPFYISAQFKPHAGIDFTLAIPEDQLSQTVKPGIGVDVNFYVPAGKSYFELTPWSFLMINRHNSEQLTGDRYTFMGFGAGYYQSLGTHREWFLGANARYGFAEGSNFDFLPGIEIVNRQKGTPIKAGLGFAYSPITENFLFKLRFGLAFKD